MNEINTTMNLWLATTKSGDVLCYGNPNSGLDYHISSLYLEPFSGVVVNGTRRWDIMEHIKNWNRQCRSKVFRCKSVKVAITIKEIKKGE